MLPFSVLLIDDHAMFRSGLAMVLRSALPNVRVSKASSLEEALQGGPSALDVLLLDIQLQGLNGLDGMALLKREWPQTPIIVLSADAMPETRRRALDRGAMAFVPKAETVDTILAAVKQVLGQQPLAAKLVAETGSDSPEPPPLTPRQCEVLDLLCRGLSNKVIGRQLGLSENTVRGHVQAVLAALQVRSRSEAAYAARQQGLVR